MNAATASHGRRPGRRSWLTLLAGALAVMVGLVGTLGGGGRGDAPPTREPSSVGCAPTSERPGPAIDLSVQLAAGDALLSDDELAVLIDLARAAGADVLSTQVSLEDVQPSRRGPRDWSNLDRFVAAADDAGLEARVTLRGTPAWALNPEKPGPATRAPGGWWERAQWAELTGALAGRYRDRLDYLEVWSAPDDFAGWSGPPDPAAYGALLRKTYTAVKAADPGVQVVTGGLAGNDLTYLDDLYEVLDTTPGESRPFDLVGVQAYDGDTPPSGGAPEGEDRPVARLALGDGVDSSLLGVRDLHLVMAGRGDEDKDVYVTGYGYRTQTWLGAAPVADAERADYLTDALEVLTCSPSVRAVSWYYQPTSDRDASWTLLDDSLTPNLTYRALAAWSERVAALRGEAATR